MTEKDARKYIAELYKIVDTNSILVKFTANVTVFYAWL